MSSVAGGSTEMESTSITFEWLVKDLKNLFESSKGDAKSKVTKSMKFGGGRWQILFYPNAGVEGGYLSLYLSCEPTTEEKESVSDGKWVREGVYKFSFELKNTTKTSLYNMKEAHNHSFSYKTANWGWAQFAKRDVVYYQSNAVKQQDALLVICKITSSPATPRPVPTVPRLQVPKDLLETIGSLLDDPTYSDVEFVLPRRGRTLRNARRIWAARRLLKRADYFDTMFNSGFAEASQFSLHVGNQMDVNDSMSEMTSFMNGFEDSDTEDESVVDEEDDSAFNMDDSPMLTSGSMSHVAVETGDGGSISASSIPTLVTAVEEPSAVASDAGASQEPRNVRAKLSHPSSPRSRNPNTRDAEWQHDLGSVSSQASTSATNKLSVVVTDVAYSTYRAVLYYIYTDTIVFAPLSSSFISSSHAEAPTPPAMSTVPSVSEGQINAGGNPKSTQSSDGTPSGPTSRRQWIQEWQDSHPGRPAPCSAKAAYRLADKLDLRDLKERASQHIIKSLTPENIAYEAFSPFSAAFETIRKVQVDFFLEHWTEIRSSDAMRNVWQQIRVGRHPGFEEVWPYIALHLEFKPRAANGIEGEQMAE